MPIKLFAMADTQWREYLSKETEESDITELAYTHNFTFDGVSENFGSTASVVRNFLVVC